MFQARGPHMHGIQNTEYIFNPDTHVFHGNQDSNIVPEIGDEDDWILVSGNDNSVLAESKQKTSFPVGNSSWETVEVFDFIIIDSF